jgi:ATP-binding protein involved in chromosome partitioning
MPDPVTTAAVYEALSRVKDPELNHDLVSLGIIREVEIEEEGVVCVDVQLTSPHCPFARQIIDSVRTAVKSVPGVTKVEIDWLCSGDE